MHVVCLLDVIEHLSDPVATIREAARSLTNDGCLIINVPAHPRLWSSADEVLGHAKRYTKRCCAPSSNRVDARMVWSSHVFSWLVAARLASTAHAAVGEPQLGLDVASPFIDRIAMLLTRI